MEDLKEYRCTCGKLLLRGILLASVIEIKCKRCGAVCLFREISKDLFISRDGEIISLENYLTCDEDGSGYRNLRDGDLG